jgi:hypothetical protein
MARLRLYYFPQVTGRTLGGAHLRSLVLDQCGLTNDGFISLIRVFSSMRHDRTRTTAHDTRTHDTNARHDCAGVARLAGN